MVSLHILFRSCAVVKTLSKTSKRPFGLDKPTMILKSLKSLLSSCSKSKDKIFLEIVDDSSPEEFRDKMRDMLKNSKVSCKFHPMNFRNNGKSLKYCYDLASKSKSDIIYFCEDDYIHFESEIKFVLDAYKEKIVGSNQFCVHPTDYPDRYKRLYPSYVFLSSSIHWRSIAHTTGTLYVPKKVFDRFSKNFFTFADMNSGSIGGGEDKTLNKIFDEVPCISPIPSLAAHLNDDTLPSLVDWKKLIDSISI